MIALVTIMFAVTWGPLHSILFAMKVYKDFPFVSQKIFALKRIISFSNVFLVNQYFF